MAAPMRGADYSGLHATGESWIYRALSCLMFCRGDLLLSTLFSVIMAWAFFAPF